MPGLWGGNVFGGDFGLGERGQSLSAGMMGIAQGLLSQRPGEGWAPALGRGFGMARGNVEDVAAERRREEDDRRRVDEEEKQKALEYYMMDEATNPANDEETRRIMEVGANLGGAAGAQIFSQGLQAQARRNEAVTARTNRGIDRRAEVDYSGKIREEIAIRREDRAAARDAENMQLQRKEDIATIDMAEKGHPGALQALGIADPSQIPKDLIDWRDEQKKLDFLQTSRERTMRQGRRDENELLGGGVDGPVSAVPVRQ